MYDFNSISNRFMKVNYDEYLSVLKKFINHIESCSIIYDYIKDCGEPTFDVAKEVLSVEKSGGREYFYLGKSEQEEVSNIYHILKYIADKDLQIFRGIADAYALQSGRNQDKTNGFNDRVVFVLIRHIGGYLAKIGIDMGVDESTKYSITVNNGQVNLASDNAVINATQNNGIDVSELKSILKTIRELSKALPSESREEINESLEVIETEIASGKPKKSMIKTALKTLVSLSFGIVSSAKFVKSIEDLKQFFKSYIEQAG